jgi:hypothetical protein
MGNRQAERHQMQHEINFFLIWIVGGGIKVHSTLRPLNGLLCQPRVIMIMEKLVEWFAGETEVLGENLPPCRFVYHKPHMLPVREPGKPASNRWATARPSTKLLSPLKALAMEGDERSNSLFHVYIS